ncbi:hypothetical protein HDU97_006991, partial [Phlyctochytrium planicorne]
MEKSPLPPLVKKKRGRKPKAQKEAEAAAAQREVIEPMHWTDGMVRELLKQRRLVQKSYFSDSRVKQNLTTGLEEDYASHGGNLPWMQGNRFKTRDETGNNNVVEKQLPSYFDYMNEVFQNKDGLRQIEMADGGQLDGETRDISPFPVDNGYGPTALDQAKTTTTSVTGVTTASATSHARKKAKVDHPTIVLGESMKGAVKYLAESMEGPSNSLAGKTKKIQGDLLAATTQSKEIQGHLLVATKQLEGSLNSSITSLGGTMKESMKETMKAIASVN